MANSFRRRPCVVGTLLVSLWALGWWAARAAADDSYPRVVRIDIECAEPIDEQGIRRLLPFDVGDELRPGSLDEARHLLELREVFETIDIDTAAGPGGLIVTLRLRRLPLVNLVRFAGNDALGDEELRRRTRLRSGSPLTTAARDYATGRITEAYEVEGFVDVRVEPVVLLVAPGEVDVQFAISEGKPLTVSVLDLMGVPESLHENLVGEIDLRVGDRYAEQTCRAAEQAIIRYLRTHGYYEVRVEASWSILAAHQGRLVFEIDSGPLFEVEFRGNEAFSDKDLLETMSLADRPIITDGTWRELARRAVRAYQEEGYYGARVVLVAVDTRKGPVPTKVVSFEVHEGAKLRVREVDFTGNHSVSTARLRSAMQTRPPSWIPWLRGVVVDDVLAEDLRRIIAVYHRRGFLSARIASSKVEEDDDALVVRIEVEEGVRVVVRDLQMVGFDVLVDRVPSIQTQVGKPLDQEKLESDRRALSVALATAGYIDAAVRVDATISEDGTDPRDASIAVTAEPGQQVRVGEVVVQNNFDTRGKVVLRELPFRSGDVLAPDQLLRGQGEVYKLGLFRSVTVRAEDDASKSAVRDVVVRVAEKPPGSFQWGLGYNTRDGFRGIGQVGYRNLQGLNRSISLRGQVDVDVDDTKPSQYLADLSYRMPDLLDTRTDGSLKFVAQRSQRDIDNFKLERLAFVPGVERPLWERTIGGIALQIDQTRVFDLAADIASESRSSKNPCVQESGRFVGSCPFDDEGRMFSVSIDPFLVRNDLDDEFRPKSGMFESVRLRLAPGVLGTDRALVKIVGQHSHYVPLHEFLTFIYAVRVGWARTLQGDEQVPIQERFFLGGRTTVRGFSENAVGPEARCDPDDPEEEKCPHHPLGGDVSINLNAEVQFPLLYGFLGAVFVDGGGVYLQTYNAKGENFRESAGVGLRYMTPVGPLSLDYGFKLDRRDGESLGQIHFSVGRVF